MKYQILLKTSKIYTKALARGFKFLIRVILNNFSTSGLMCRFCYRLT